MPEVYPRRDWPTLPEEEGGLYLAPAHGAFLASLADYTNHLGACRHIGRRYVRKTFNYQTNQLGVTPVQTNQDLRVVWPSSPIAEHVFVGVAYQAVNYANQASDATALGTSPRIVATLLNHSTAAVIDNPGMKWDYADGTLPTRVRVNGIDAADGVVNDLTLFGAEYPIQYVHTGIETNDSAVAQTRPRPLNVDGNGGITLRLRLVTTNVRVHHVDVWELFERSVTV